MNLAQLKTPSMTRKAMADYYESARNARKEGRLVAWCTMGAPYEILTAAGIDVVFPENHSATCGARNEVPSLSMLAENAGLSQDVCSYVRGDLGSRLGGNSPVGGMPEPDLLVCNNVSCQTVTKWYQELARYYGCELVVIDMPYNFSGSAEAHSIEYMVGQFKDLIACIETLQGQKYDMENLKNVVALSQKAGDLCQDILELGQCKPSPLSMTDVLINMGPMACMRGQQACIDIYQTLYEEVKARADAGYAAAGDEKYRLIWDNIPMWSALGDVVKRFAEGGCALVTATYLYHWHRTLDPDNPLESLASQCSTCNTMNMSLEHKIEKIGGLIDAFQADGLVIHSNRSCKPDALGSFDLQRAITERFGIPVLVFESDHADSRAFSEGAIDTRISAYMETLRQKPSLIHSG